MDSSYGMISYAYRTRFRFGSKMSYTQSIQDRASLQHNVQRTKLSSNRGVQIVVNHLFTMTFPYIFLLFYFNLCCNQIIVSIINKKPYDCIKNHFFDYFFCLVDYFQTLLKMNKKLLISSGNSQMSGNGRNSMFESNVTPFFGSMRKQKFESDNKQSSFGAYRGNQQELNTQQIIQRIVKQNQNRSIDDDGMGDFRLGFSFADEFHSQDDNNFSFDPTLIGQPFSFMSNFQSQSPKFFESNVSIDPLFRSGFSTYSNPKNHTGQSQQGFTTTINNEKKSPFHDFFSFPIECQQHPTEDFINEQNKKTCSEKQFEGRSKDIIYEVESKFECEGQTHFLDNTNESKSLSHHSKPQKVAEESEKKTSEYEMLRQSIIKQISQMDSDEWEHRNEDFDEIKNQSNPKSNKNLFGSQKLLSEVQPQQKKINFNESIINKLFLESEKQIVDQVVHIDVKKNEQPHKRKYQQKNNDSIYESEVQQMTNQRLDMFKKSSKTITGKRNIDSIQKSKDSLKNEKKEDSNQNNTTNTSYQAKKSLNFFLRRNKQDLDSQKHQQITQERKNKEALPKEQKNSETEENQNRRKRPVFNLKSRNRLNMRNQVIDERQEFQNEQKLPIVRRQFFSEDLQIQNDLDSKPIEMYQSATKQQTKEKKFNVFNLKRRTSKESNSIDQIEKLKQLPSENKNHENQIKVENAMKAQQKPPIKKFQLSFKRKFKRESNEKSQQKSQKLSQAYQKHSVSSDGIKIDTKGFMDKVLNNNQGGNNNRNQTKLKKDKKNPILNFKRINRFTSLFGKYSGKQKEKQKEKQKQEERNQTSVKKTVPNIIEQTPVKISKPPLVQLNLQPVLKVTSANQYQSAQKKQKLAQNQVTYKSYEKDQEGQQLSLQEERKNPFISKYTFSKRTPPRQFGKNNVQSKSKSVTFDTVKRVEINENDDIDDDNLSFNSVPYQRFPNNTFKGIQATRRENNLMKGIDTVSKKQHPIQSTAQVPPQRFNLHSQSSSMPTISSRSRKSAQMMREILQVIEQAHTLQLKLLRVKRQREEEYRRISFLNRVAKEKFSDERIKEMMDWGEMEVQFESWGVKQIG